MPFTPVVDVIIITHVDFAVLEYVFLNVQSAHIVTSCNLNNDKKEPELHLCRVSCHTQIPPFLPAAVNVRCHGQCLLVVETHLNIVERRWSTDASRVMKIPLGGRSTSISWICRQNWSFYRSTWYSDRKQTLPHTSYMDGAWTRHSGRALVWQHYTQEQKVDEESNYVISSVQMETP